MIYDQKTRVRTTENHSIVITGEELREMINLELKAIGGNILPPDAEIYVQVPGGGDWSNEVLDLRDFPLNVKWTVEKAEGDL